MSPPPPVGGGGDAFLKGGRRRRRQEDDVTNQHAVFSIDPSLLAVVYLRSPACLCLVHDMSMPPRRRGRGGRWRGFIFSIEGLSVKASWS